jgi:alkylhydroperoxidase/carboxymuconolactone decarboxylase family protein YurZ
VLTLPERQMAACTMLAALGAIDELKLHVNAALFLYRDVLKERGEWPIK